MVQGGACQRTRQSRDQGPPRQSSSVVKIKWDIENQIRGLLKNLGLVIGQAKMNVSAVCAAELPANRPALTAAVEPLLKAREAVGRQIAGTCQDGPEPLSAHKEWLGQTPDIQAALRPWWSCPTEPQPMYLIRWRIAASDW
jgi:hypothetical protein